MINLCPGGHYVSGTLVITVSNLKDIKVLVWLLTNSLLSLLTIQARAKLSSPMLAALHRYLALMLQAFPNEPWVEMGLFFSVTVILIAAIQALQSLTIADFKIYLHN